MLDAYQMSRREAPRFGLLLHIGTATAFRVGTFIGWLETTADDTLDPSQIYKGVGILTGLPALRQIVDGSAERLDFKFSAAAAVPQSWVDDPESDISGADVNVGLVFFGDDWSMLRQPDGSPPVSWLWHGRADVASWVYEGGKESIALSCGSEFTDRGRAGMRFWTQASHQSRHPGDNFCKLVVGYTVTRMVKWPG
jgi:hypothetical protein